MHYLSILRAGLSLFQRQENGLTITNIPDDITAGVPVKLKWIGGNSTDPVTISLVNEASGNSYRLSNSATGGTYTWTPPRSLPNGIYDLEIYQSPEGFNDSRSFTLSGGSASSAALTSSIPSLSLGTTTAPAVSQITDGLGQAPTTAPSSTTQSSSAFPSSAESSTQQTSIFVSPMTSTSTPLAPESSEQSRSTGGRGNAPSNAASSTTQAATTSSASGGSTADKPASARLHTGQLVGTIVGVFVVAVIVALFGLFLFRRHFRRHRPESPYDLANEPIDIKFPAEKNTVHNEKKDEEYKISGSHVEAWTRDKKRDTSTDLKELPADSHFQGSEPVCREPKVQKLE